MTREGCMVVEAFQTAEGRFERIECREPPIAPGRLRCRKHASDDDRRAQDESDALDLCHSLGAP